MSDNGVGVASQGLARQTSGSVTASEKGAKESDRCQDSSQTHDSPTPTPSLSHKSASCVHESSLDSSCVAWLTQRLRLLFPASSSSLRGSAQSASQFVDELFDPIKHALVFEDFLRRTDGLPLFVSLTASRHLNMATAVPQTGSYASFMYFMKPTTKEDQNWTPSALTDSIQVGVVNGKDPLLSLQTSMQSVIAPLIFNSSSWPDTIRKDLHAATHKFMSVIVQRVNSKHGDTILYLPKIDSSADPSEAAHDNELVQLLETCVIHATRQVKDVLNKQDDLSRSGSGGPLAEIEFWRARSADLSRIRNQMDSPECSHIITVLEHSKSSYLPRFLNLRSLIQHEAVAAEDNVKFLLVLEEPCKVLAAALPEEIPAALPSILHRVRLIWNLSRFYSVPDRITGLLRKVSNEIISRCCAAIKLPEVFSPNVTNVSVVLQQCIKAGDKWKALYERTAAAVTAKSVRPWDFSQSPIFAHVDAFIQRCADLLEVCHTQLQFGSQRPLPVFGGTNGSEVRQSVADIRAAYKGRVEVLATGGYPILDARVTRWHDDFNAFRAHVKDLEEMLIKATDHALASVSCLQDGIVLIEALQTMAVRDRVRRHVVKKTSEMYQEVLNEINTVKRLLDTVKRSPERSPVLPARAAQAFWAHHLSRRLEITWEVLQRVRVMLPEVSDGTNYSMVENNYSLAQSALAGYITQVHASWHTCVPATIAKDLDCKLLSANASEGGMLTCTFNKTALTMFQEVQYWERMRLPVPYVAMEVQAQREKYRVLIDKNLGVVREYNAIITSVAGERRLFTDRLRHLDRRVNSGVNKLSWNMDRSALEFYQKEARKFCREGTASVGRFKSGVEAVRAACARIAELMLVDLERKGVVQRRRAEATEAILREIAAEIAAVKDSLYEIFANDGAEVQQQWLMFTERLDREVLAALGLSVKRSLAELSRAINGDAKTEVLPLFYVSLELDRAVGTSDTVELRPTLQELANMIRGVCREMLQVSKVVPRVVENVHDRLPADSALGIGLARVWAKGDKPFFQLITENKDTPKQVTDIIKGVSNIVPKVQAVLVDMETKYKKIWDTDKSAYMRRYKRNAAQRDFDGDIRHYLQLIDEIRSEESVVNVQFLQIDQQPLKAWVAKFSLLLHEIAIQELQSLYDYLRSNTERLHVTPSTLDELAQVVNLQSSLDADQPNIIARFQPLQNMFSILGKHDVAISDVHNAQLVALPNEWENFKSVLQEAAGSLDDAKESFRERVRGMVDTFGAEVNNISDTFAATAPFSNVGHATAMALSRIKEQRAVAAAARQKSADLKAGMDIFSIPQPPYKELGSMEVDIERLDAIWTIVSEWEASYNTWKQGKFREIQVQDLEEAAARIGKNVAKLGRDIKHWEVWQWIRDRIDTFKRTMPLISDLRNPAMRPRHWKSLVDAIQTSFDPTSDAFTLDSIVALRLDQHAEFISEMSVNATKELAIEQSLAAIAEAWKTLDLDMPLEHLQVEYKSTFKLRSTEDAFAALEDNTVTLSTMKASKFFIVFETEITTWEKTLSIVSEMLEMVLQVQRTWQYLENIFVGSEDIRKQLPQESVLFDIVHASFVERMAQLVSLRNIVKACTANGMLGAFTDMYAKLEKIQKSLEDYLEAKRQQFPRFYFLSSDDLLEILGQAKDPENVQTHLKKCFEGVKRLAMHAPGAEGRRQWESSAIFSPDGERLPLNNNIITEGRPEEWLNDVEAAMFAACKTTLYNVLETAKATKKEKWVKENQGQCIISAGQIIWTMECEKALSDPEAAKKSIRQLKKKWVSYLNKLTGITRSRLNKIERNKTVSLITIEVHARDVLDKLAKSGCTATTDFEWVSQLRFYWDRESDDCVVRQVLSVFKYGYEYQGNNGRLVITPLTDRCYMTLGAALFTRRGGNPLGPAGTGKTETVKDFGKALARYVIVFNCSDGVDYRMTGKMLSGLAQTGAWACLDEFNRIEVEVLSVVATQIATLMAAVKIRASRFNFLGANIRLVLTCGVFVTMNPGYAGRSELPDNLKALVRPVSMMVPDFTLIAEIMMFSEGFAAARPLSKKMIAIMELSQQQLSKQDHYDYSLRSFVIPIARAAGALKRLDPEGSEEVIMYRTMLDLIKPKLVYLDLPLFMALLSDLFPGVELPSAEGGELKAALEADLKAHGLQIVPEFLTKIIQIFDCKVARHGNMIVGRTGSGKTVAWRTLARSLAVLKESHSSDERYQRVHPHILNPLALSNDEIYGYFDPGTHEWQDGVLAKVMRTVCRDESPDQKWILFDGPVDTLWIESMNTLLDDNKLLTLLSGERISMPPAVSILFEVEDLSQASPATVSRAGMIYLNVEDLGWQPFVQSWLQKKESTVAVETITKLVDKWIGHLTEYKRLECKELVPCDRLAAIATTTRLFDALATPENGVDPTDSANYVPMLENWFLFCLVWGVGGSLDDMGRKSMDAVVRELDSRFPTTGTVFDYVLDVTTRTWLPWESRLSASFRPPPGVPFFKVLVPTADTVRYSYLASSLMRRFHHVLMAGDVGVGKTMIAEALIGSLPEGRFSMTINFSAQTSSNSLQDTIEGRLEKRSKGVFAPVGGKRLVAFIDDLNMPQKSTFGFIPPLELLKLWADNGFWYDRKSCEPKEVRDMQLLAAMAPPGGGRNAFSARILSCFSLLCVTSPSDGQLRRIYSALLSSHLADFGDVIKPLGESITQATVELYRAVVKELLPTPTKSHYLFNTRDLARIIQGTTRASKSFFDTKELMLTLWVHEALRVIGDRMWDPADLAWLQKQLEDRLSSIFSISWNDLFEPYGGECPPFVNFLRPGMDPPPYEPATDISALKALLTEKLEDYGMEPGCSAMDLVLFKDALMHLCRISRVLAQPRGNALLVGVGGSGRKSLARLATFVAEQKCFSIQISKNYRITEFREDLKELYKLCGCQNKPTTFLFDETQIKYETFVEDINNILTSGEVPNLFGKDEIGPVVDEVRADAKKAGVSETQDALYSFFLERVRTNLHVVLCLSPIGDGFRTRCRMFPGLVNCTTIDWFTPWPSDALFEVASKLLESADVGSADIRKAVCQVFVTAHESVSTKSDEMFEALKRRNYVTPTNYLEFVEGYKSLLSEKKRKLADKAGKLRGGLTKLDETTVQVGEMQVVAREKQEVVSKAKASCEDLVKQIVQDKRVAQEQEKQVNAEAEKIGKEAAEADEIARVVQGELDKALPALQSAEDALNVLTKKDISELKAYAKPPGLVELTLQAVMTALKRSPTWDEAKKALGDPSFMEKLMKFNKDTLDEPMIKKLAKFTNNKEFAPESVGKVSGAARGMCLWVHAMKVYGEVAKEVGPKRAKLKSAQDNLAKKQAQLSSAQERLAEVLAAVQALKDQYDESTTNKKALETELADLTEKLERAEKLVTGLAGEKARWQQSIADLDANIERLPGDVVVAAAFMSYAGPFPSEYRIELTTQIWLPMISELKIPASDGFSFSDFLADPADVRDWNIMGLPADAFSTENGVMTTRGQRWPLMIDPQGQANKWIKNMEGPRGLKVVDLQMQDLARQIENAIQFGNPVLLQNILEEMDPVLEPVLAKAFIKRGNQTLIAIGDKEVDYNPDFKLYITTKLSNPHYTPEISTKAMILNFSVKEDGLEAQLLSLVVKMERPDLDKMKNELVVNVAQGKRTQAELEDQILQMLATATGSLLDNVELINTLDASKTTWEEVNAMLAAAEETSRKIEATSQQYRPCSVRASLLFFVLADLSRVDGMYQFSLDAYTDLFSLSITDSPKSDMLLERIRQLNDYHTYAMYKYTSRGLFERHKLLLSLQMTSRVLSAASALDNTEFGFFLCGGTVLDRSTQPTNPDPTWISEEAWDNITELENQVPTFRGIVGSVESTLPDWEAWFRDSNPESADLPGEWESKCSDLQRMVIVRCLRPDRVLFAASAFVSNNLGRKYVEPPVLDLAEVFKDSNPTAPLIFVLSPGVDPTDALKKLAAEKDMADRVMSVALGQGQAPVATKLIDEGIQEGHWVFLANCHLMTSWLPALEKIIEGLPGRKPHPNFRLWLSSSPSPAFPIAILQRGLKMTTEPPKGLRANLLRLYGTIDDASYAECKTVHKYQRLLFSLAYFHSVLLERRKFRTLGLNIPYDFNDTDFRVSDDLLKSYLDAYKHTPWDALRYLIAEANYGGRVTDELDRRVIASYLNKFYCEDVLAVPNYPLSPLPTYYVPAPGPLSSFKDYISGLPTLDPPEAFGQHPNAEISYLIEDSKVVLSSLLGLQPTVAAGTGGMSKEEIVSVIATDLFEHVPPPFNLEAVMKAKADDPSALHVVLFQELERYNALLVRVRRSCSDLLKGIQGLVVMSADLDLIFSCLLAGRVPPLWLKTYPSIKPLGSWTRDLLQRIDQLARWVEGTYPTCFWLAGFTYPTGFLTAVLQTTARRNSIPIDILSFEFSVVHVPAGDIAAPPKEGVYIHGMFLEGAGWDEEEECLCEPQPMELIVSMPVILFKPVENKKRGQRGVYSCPLYLYPIRTGTRERPSFMINVDLKSGASEPDHWIMRGTALLLALAT